MTAPNFAPGTLWTGDNLAVMRGLNSGCIDLVYLDPPFNSGTDWQAPIGHDGSEEVVAKFKDTWSLSDIDHHEHGELADRNPGVHKVIEAAKLTHGGAMMSYLIFMAVRLIEIRRILKDTGTAYLHVDPTASHYLKLVMDGIFGRARFRNEIIWGYAGGGIPKRDFPRKHDVILRYTKGDGCAFNTEYREYGEHIKASPRRATDRGGTRKTEYNPQGTPVNDWWTDIKPLNNWSGEKTGYPTQKPLALLERIIRVSSDAGGTVFDPFCGCATTLVAADRLGRQWIGCDLSPLAIQLVQQRIRGENTAKHSSLMMAKHGDSWRVTALDSPPRRTDQGTLPNYRTHRHALFGRQEGRCNGCGQGYDFKFFETDHVLPVAKGGTDHIANLQLLCRPCNAQKQNKTMAEWKAWRARKGLPVEAPWFPNLLAGRRD